MRVRESEVNRDLHKERKRERLSECGPLCGRKSEPVWRSDLDRQCACVCARGGV